MKRSMILGGALVCAAVATGGCNNNKNRDTSASRDATVKGDATTASAPMNTKCPYSGGKVNRNITSEHDGKTVAFCCGGCKGKFDRSSDAEQDAVVSKAE